MRDCFCPGLRIFLSLWCTPFPAHLTITLTRSVPSSPQRVRQEYMDVESEYLDRKGTYDKVAVGLEMDKQALEKECDTFQVSTDLSKALLQE
jgi:hypothetical protein